MKDVDFQGEKIKLFRKILYKTKRGDCLNFGQLKESTDEKWDRVVKWAVKIQVDHTDSFGKERINSKFSWI